MSVKTFFIVKNIYYVNLYYFMIFIIKTCSKNVFLSEYYKISTFNENKGGTRKVCMLNYNAENIIIN